MSSWLEIFSVTLILKFKAELMNAFLFMAYIYAQYDINSNLMRYGSGKLLQLNSDYYLCV